MFQGISLTHVSTVLRGRAALIVIGAVSSGSGGGPTSDLAIATALATDLATSYGFSERQKLLWTGGQTLDESVTRLSISPALSGEVQKTLDEAYADAVRLLTPVRDTIENVAQALLNSVALTGTDVAALVHGVHVSRAECDQ